MALRVLLPLTVMALVLSSCSKQAASAPHATVTLRDGTTTSGQVLSSSSTQLQLAGDDKITRTIPMSQVRSIDYDAAPASAAPAAPAPAAPGTMASAPPNGNPEPVAPASVPAETAVTTKTFLLPPGTRVSVRTEETIDSARAAEGQTYAAEVTHDVRDARGDRVIPRGANARLMIVSVSRGGHFRGASDLVLDVASVSIDGRRYGLRTSDISDRGRQGVGANKGTGEFVGGGAAIGAVIGAIAGHGTGAAIGAGAGAGGGALAQVVTRGTVKVPAESVLTFRLEAPLRVEAQ